MKHHSHQPELKIVSIEWVETPDAKQRLGKVFEILLREPVTAEVDNGLTRPGPIRPVTNTNTPRKEVRK